MKFPFTIVETIATIAIGATAFVAFRTPEISKQVMGKSLTAIQSVQIDAPTPPVVAISKKNPVARTPVTNKLIATKLMGSYRCYSYNVSGGGGGNCRLFAPIVLKKDGTYSMSSEKGTYSASGNMVILSGSKLRGPGTVIDGNKLRFEYDYNGWHHTLTYLREEGINPEEKTSTSKSKIVILDLTMTFPKGYGIDWFNAVELVPHSDGVLTYFAIAYAENRSTLKAYFNAVKKLKSGDIYDVFASTGTDRVKIGSVDLVNSTGGETAITIAAQVQ